jgi:hypothetical protein
LDAEWGGGAAPEWGGRGAVVKFGEEEESEERDGGLVIHMSPILLPVCHLPGSRTDYSNQFLAIRSGQSY